MAPFASFLLLFRQLLGSVGARLLPGFGFEPVRPKWIAPVYFPAWVIDAELETSITHIDVQVCQRCAITFLVSLHCSAPF